MKVFVVNVSLSAKGHMHGKMGVVSNDAESAVKAVMIKLGIDDPRVWNGVSGVPEYQDKLAITVESVCEEGVFMDSTRSAWEGYH